MSVVSHTCVYPRMMPPLKGSNAKIVTHLRSVRGVFGLLVVSDPKEPGEAQGDALLWVHLVTDRWTDRQTCRRQTGRGTVSRGETEEQVEMGGVIRRIKARQ